MKRALGLALALGLLLCVKADSQPAPDDIAGCVYNASLPTLSDKQIVVLQCDINGKLILH